MTWLRYFQAPWLLVLAIVLPLAALALAYVWARRRRARVTRLGAEPLVSRLAPSISGTGARWRALRLGGAVLFGAIALAGPRWGNERSEMQSSGVDVVLALDASLSMLATDERPDRLTRMKQEVRRLRAMTPGDRVALLAFAGRSYILTPLTTDEGAIDLFLDNLDPSVVGQAGSSLARAIRQGTELLQSTRGRGGDRAIVVMSDGEAFEAEDDVREAARQAADAGIIVVTVGFGTAQGTTIPVHEGNTTTLKRDESGNVVVTHYVPDLLRAAAEMGRGTFIPAEATDKAARVRAALGNLRAQRRAVAAGNDLTPRFQLFVAPALLLVLLDAWLSTRRRASRREAPAAARAAALLLFALLPMLSGCTRRELDDDALGLYQHGDFPRALAAYRERVKAGGTPRAVYNFGTALLAADSAEPARDALDRARQAPDTGVRWRAQFNLGLLHLRRGLETKGDGATEDLDAALALYKQVLLAHPADSDAKWNYELALHKKKQQSGGGGGGGGGGGQGAPPQAQPQPRPAGGLGERQAEELLNAAARDERDVQGKKQKQNQPPPPPGGKDW
ncbi:von Willebrand factor type A [Gemmatirosa kalamazoonensis]|uniref:von Willebrand factor type A n=1 Tax=Gemmatirosa kalamazoonensis TaxID=861299 RepID=W0RK57_9BACT|nr:VWA domain-containing protein [Gemmatirosa kalamazoonensis]AHG90690.1 von Willebrand factor type A [Gemmatirosa kalamazoonensis]